MPLLANIWSTLTQKFSGGLGSIYVPFISGSTKVRMLIETGKIPSSSLAVAVGLSLTLKL